MSHPGTSSASMMMTTMAQSTPTSPPERDHANYYSPPISPLYHTNSHPNDSLEERRQRNKEASAKYRQRKNTQQRAMRNTICQLSDRNAMLERQLQEVRQENQKLRATADKLRGKLVVSRLLGQWMQRHPNTRQVDMSQIDMDTVVTDSDEDDALLMHDL
jgi:predicted nuclease with TOPRIM domain